MIMVTPGMSTPPCWRSIPFFTEFPRFEGEDIEMYAFLDLGDTGTPDVVAGFSPNQPPLPPTCRLHLRPIPCRPSPMRWHRRSRPSMPDTGPGFGTTAAQ